MEKSIENMVHLGIDFWKYFGDLLEENEPNSKKKRWKNRSEKRSIVESIFGKIFFYFEPRSKKSRWKNRSKKRCILESIFGHSNYLRDSQQMGGGGGQGRGRGRGKSLHGELKPERCKGEGLKNKRFSLDHPSSEGWWDLQALGSRGLQ